MKKSRRTAAALAAMLALAAAFYLIYSNFKPEVSEGEKHFTIKVVHSDFAEKTFSYSTDDEYLGEVLLESGLIKGEKGPYGLYITEVDGEQAVYEKDKAYWALYVNGDYAALGIDVTPISDGDEFSLAYTAG